MGAPKTLKFRLKFLFQEVDLESGAFTIGRSPSCNITLEDPLVSRTHARITVLDDHAILDDLGSRNGTLVNGEPIFDNHRLANRDRIRIGTHDFVFVEEKRHPSTQLRATGLLVSCPRCRVPYPSGTPSCPHCGMVAIPDTVCPTCRAPAGAADLFCPQCGTPLAQDDSTIPVEMGGSSAGFTPEMVTSLIRKAIAARRYDQAARMLDDKIGEFERAARSEAVDIEALAELSILDLIIAKALRDPDRVEWIFGQWSRFAAPMPERVLAAIEGECMEWHDPRPGLSSYLERLEQKSGPRPPIESLLNALKRIIGRTE
ncbi:MAG: FHA domain-containing protein [Deltaproteobacteria bacterium]|nr:FHA domain-containing protein [Deltaproteobacteria bacterium]